MTETNTCDNKKIESHWRLTVRMTGESKIMQNIKPLLAECLIQKT